MLMPVFSSSLSINKQNYCNFVFDVGLYALQSELIRWYMLKIYRSSGRVARQRSAKPFTAVRIRSRPHQISINHCNSINYNGIIFFFAPLVMIITLFPLVFCCMLLDVTCGTKIQEYLQLKVREFFSFLNKGA